ncbi:hypothetical protein [Cupriavidus sp. USMAA2-4]|uniref:hypothetical protein n=1 Tax=Cupriavidus sp. USMAA2-4 TaxID=876364 RepID=UPI0012F498FE|nr:hypothetical protein [Cupriavidus sp. USMAA2-4]
MSYAERKAKRKAKHERQLERARAAHQRTTEAMQVSRVYAADDFHRDANRLGPAFNRPLTPRGAGVYSVTTACTATL